MAMEEWWDKTIFRIRRVWKRVTVRLGIRNSGLLKLQNDVRTSEYEDIHILWNMIRKKEKHAWSPRTPKKTCWNLVDWARRAPCLCRNF